MNAYELAQKEVGTVEWKEGSNPKVVAYYKDAGHPEVKDDSVAWCAAFVGAMLNRSGAKGTGLLTARSYMNWGKAVDLDDAKPGDIVVFTRGNSTWQGHVGFYAGRDGANIKVLGGNQRDAVNVSSYSAASLLGIRRAASAKPAPQPQVTPAAPKTPEPQFAPVAVKKPGVGAAIAALIAALSAAVASQIQAVRDALRDWLVNLF